MAVKFWRLVTIAAIAVVVLLLLGGCGIMAPREPVVVKVPVCNGIEVPPALGEDIAKGLNERWPTWYSPAEPGVLACLNPDGMDAYGEVIVYLEGAARGCQAFVGGLGE